MVESKRLLYVADSSLGERSAQGTHNAEVAAALARRGRFTMIGGIQEGQDLPAALTMVREKEIHIAAKGSGNRVNYLRYSRFVVDALRRNGVNDDAIVYSRFNLPLLPVFRYLRRNGIPYVIEYNDDTVAQLQFQARESDDWSRAGKALRTNAISVGLIHRAEGSVFRNAAGIRAITHSLAESARRQAGPTVPVEAIPNGTNTVRIRPQERQAARAELGLRHDRKYGVHVGSLTHWDGIDRVVAALPGLPELTFLVVGAGDEVARKVQMQARRLGVAERVVFVGSVPQEVALKYVASADVCFLLKTIGSYGLSPIKYYEYMACGRAIVATDIPYINNVARDGCGAVVSQNAEPHEVEQAVRTVLADSDEMGARGRRRAVESYSWDARVHSIVEFLLAPLGWPDPPQDWRQLGAETRLSPSRVETKST